MAYPGSLPAAVVHEYLSTSLPPIIAGADQPFIMGSNNFQGGPPMQGQNYNGPNNNNHNNNNNHHSPDNFNNNNFNNNGKPNWNAPPPGPAGFAPNGVAPVGPVGPNGRPAEVKQKTEIKVDEEEEKPHGIHKITHKLHIHRKHKS